LTQVLFTNRTFFVTAVSGWFQYSNEYSAFQMTLLR